MPTHHDAKVSGKRVAVLMTDGVEQVEYTAPRRFLEQHGVEVTLVSPKPKGDQIQGFNHLLPGERFTVEMDVHDARPADFDMLVLPGGVANPDRLRLSTAAITFIREFAREDKPIAAICHGPRRRHRTGQAHDQLAQPARRFAQRGRRMDRRGGRGRRQARDKP